MEHEFDPAAFKKKLAESGEHPASRAAEADGRIGSISNEDFVRRSPDQIDLSIRAKRVFGCAVDLKPWADRVDQSVLSLAQAIDRHGSLASLRRHDGTEAVGSDHTDTRPQPMHNPAWTISSVVRTLVVKISLAHQLEVMSVARVW